MFNFRAADSRLRVRDGHGHRADGEDPGGGAHIHAQRAAAEHERGLRRAHLQRQPRLARLDPPPGQCYMLLLYSNSIKC